MIFFLSFPQSSSAEKFCPKLEGLVMTCVSSPSVPPGNGSNPGNPPTCTQTCQPSCRDYKICIGTDKERICPGTPVTPEACSAIRCYSKKGPPARIAAMKSCDYPTGQYYCANPIVPDGDGCQCNGTCTANGATCTFTGTQTSTCFKSCSCAPGTPGMGTKRWCEPGAGSCQEYEQIPAEVRPDGCGCACPSGTSSNLPSDRCTGSTCTPEPKPPECR